MRQPWKVSVEISASLQVHEIGRFRHRGVAGDLYILAATGDTNGDGRSSIESGCYDSMKKRDGPPTWAGTRERLADD